MKTRLIILVLLCVCSSALFAQNEVQQVVIDSEEYHSLKQSGDLNSPGVELVEPEEHNLAVHTTVYPAGHGTEGRSINCDCWVEPDETYTQTSFGPDGTDDGTTGLIDIPFAFNLYGNSYGNVYINTNGNLTFSQAFTTFTPVGFPFDVAMVAPFWGDVDFGCANCGDVFYKITEDAMFVNFMDVGYFNEQNDKVNTFQVIITNGENNFVGVGNNVNFCYQDMQWTTGSASGGTNGFGGSPATVGANEGNGVNFIQFGRFDQEGDDYDGPFGFNDGVSWLDDQSITFNAATNSNNIQPIASVNEVCDTLTVCVNQTESFNFTFLAPEANQTVDIEVDSGGATGVSNVQVNQGNTASISFDYTGLPENAGGFFPITIIATDDGTPAASTSITQYVEVIDVEIPVLDVDGITSICPNEETVLTATPGFDTYTWTNSGGDIVCDVNECTFATPGELDLVAEVSGCVSAISVDIESSPVFLVDVAVENNNLCPGDSTLVEVLDEYVTYSWSVQEGQEGNILGPVNEQTTYVEPGLYIVQAIDEDGCPGQRGFEVASITADIPEDTFSGTFCDELSEVDFCCGSSSTTPGQFRLFFNIATGPWSEGASVEVVINGEVAESPDAGGPGPYPTAEQLDGGGGLIIVAFPIDYGDEIEVNYTSNGSEITTGLNISNCAFTSTPTELDPNGGLIYSADADCAFEEADGLWTVIEGPDGATFSDDMIFNSTFTPGDYGTYELNFFSATCGIDYQYELNYSQSPSLEILTEGPVEICDGDDTLLEASVADPQGDADFSWSTEETTESITVSETGEYCATIENACASIQDCIDVTFTPVPEFDLDPEYNLCDEATITIDPVTNDDPTFAYNWSSDQGFSGDGATEDITETASYTVVVSNDCGDFNGDFSVVNLPTPTASLDGLPDLLCDGETVLLDPVDAADEHPSFEYDWSTGADDSEISVANSGEYSVSVSNDCGTAEADVSITALNSPSPSLLGSYTECAGGDIDLNPINNDPSYSYMWTLPDGSIIEPSDPEITADVAGEYIFSVSNACTPLGIEVSTDVIFNEAPVITLTANGGVVDQVEPTPILLCPLDAVLLEANASQGLNLNYGWAAYCTNPAEPYVFPGEFESSIIVSSDQFETIEDGCTDFGAVYLATASNQCGTTTAQAFFVPDPCLVNELNVFSPDGDGVNDSLIFEGLDVYFSTGRAVKLEVFNRWGNLVYESSDYRNDWTAKDVSDGTYFYILTFPEEGREKLRSPLTIVRK